MNPASFDPAATLGLQRRSRIGIAEYRLINRDLTEVGPRRDACSSWAVVFLYYLRFRTLSRWC